MISGRLGGWTSLGGVLVCVLSLSCGKKERAPVHDGRDPERSVDCSRIPSDRLPETTEAFAEVGCNRLVVGHISQRGNVTVPLYPGSAETITIAVVRVFSSASEVKADPIVYLDGGPGGESIANMTWLHPAMEPAAPDRDIIFIDQRGIGRSRPNLQCTESQLDIGEALDACYERLSSTVDLDAFDSVNNAHDIDQVRQALGYEKWNLLGISYGTRLGLTVMRDYPEGVRSALLDSVVPLHRDILAEVGINGYSAMLAAFEACADDTVCNRKYPDPLGQLTQAVAALNEDPAVVGRGFLLEGDLLLRLVFQLLYSPSTIGYIPMLIDDVANEDYRLFEQIDEAVSSSGGISFGMHLSLHCAEEVPFSSREAFESFDAGVPEVFRASLTGVDYLDWCQHWPVEAAPAAENEPVVSAIPSLVIAGEFDPITPPAFAEAAFEHLENARYFMIRNESHGASLGGCGLQMARDFFDDPEGPINSSCLNSLPEIEFLSVQAPGARAAVDAADVSFATERPSKEEVDRAVDDLKRRLR
jgi:pimeloyl-ACP methyl ester carboxylesterase